MDNLVNKLDSFEVTWKCKKCFSRNCKPDYCVFMNQELDLDSEPCECGLFACQPNECMYHSKFVMFAKNNNK